MHFYQVTPCIIEAQIDVSSYPSRKVYEPCWPHNFLLNPLGFSRQKTCAILYLVVIAFYVMKQITDIHGTRFVY